MFKWFLNNININKEYHYFDIYEKHFSHFRNTCVNVLEIGVDRGGSLKMWKSYFGKNANIYGLDINPECKQYENLNEGIHVIIGSQSDKKFMSEFMDNLPKIDILIDDGSHKTHDQIVTFLACYEKLSDTGIYLCEDLCTNYWKEFIDTKITFVDFIKKHLDCLTAESFIEKDFNDGYIPLFTSITHSVIFYDGVIVLEKKRKIQSISERK